jgi:signal peptidase II
MASKYKVFIVALLLSLGIDQATKVWARQSLKPKYPEVIQVISGYFELRYSENTGSAFGLGRSVPGAKYLFFVVGAIALVVVARYLVRADPSHKRIGAELGLLAGGAIGNIIDRAVFGRVTDFIVWKAGSYEWPTFNVADAALVVGVIALVFELRPEEKKRAAEAKARRK